MQDAATGKLVRGPKVDWAIVKAEKWDQPKGKARIPSKWTTMPDLMFHYRSALWLIRTRYPEVIMGMQSVDELHDAAPETNSSGPAAKSADSLADLTDKLNAKPEPVEDPPEAPPESPESKPRAKRSPNKPKEAEPVEDPPEVDLVHESKLHRDRLWQALSKAKSPAYVEAIRKEANDLWGSGDLHDEDCQAVMKSCIETGEAMKAKT